MSTPAKKDEVQGEDDNEAARRYDKASREFAESGKVEPAPHDAPPAHSAEAKELERAETDSKSHPKGEGSLVSNKRKASDA